jgi:putative membrane protein
MNDELANDRTFLAWLRSGITLFGLGFVVAKAAFVLKSGLSDKDLFATVGVLFVLSGAALMVVGYAQHRTVAHLLTRDDDRPRPRWPLTITATGAVAALLLSILIVIST